MFSRIITTTALICCLAATGAIAENNNSTCINIAGDSSETLNELLTQMTEKYEDSDDNNGLQIAILHDENQVAESIIGILIAQKQFQGKETSDPFIGYSYYSYGQQPHYSDLEAFLSHTNSNGDTALHIAASLGNLQISRGLLQINQSLNLLVAANHDLNTPTHLAVIYGHIEVVNLFLSHQDSQIKERDEKCSNFEMYTQTPHYLLNPNESGMTLLDLAVENGDASLIQLTESFIAPIAKRCKMPIDRFGLYKRKLNYVVSQTLPFLKTRQVKSIEIGESYLLEHIQGLRYLSKEERGKHQQEFYDGKLMSKTSTYDSEHACFPRFIYVMSENDEFYLGCQEYGKFHHGSFLSGANVIGAGHIEIEDGKVSSINHASGHYAPKTSQFVQTIFKLYDRGVVDEDTQLQFFAPGTGFSISFGKLLQALKDRDVDYDASCAKQNFPHNEIFSWTGICAPEVSHPSHS